MVEENQQMQETNTIKNEQNNVPTHNSKHS